MSSPGQLSGSLSSWKQDVKQLAEFLRTNHPANVIIPLRKGNKSPLHPHKGGQWTWSLFDSWIEACREPSDIGILMRDFVVLDADSQEQVQKLEEMYPACSTCPCAHTRKGRHYCFLRTNKERRQLAAFWDSNVMQETYAKTMRKLGFTMRRF